MIFIWLLGLHVINLLAPGLHVINPLAPGTTCN